MVGLTTQAENGRLKEELKAAEERLHQVGGT